MIDSIAVTFVGPTFPSMAEANRHLATLLGENVRADVAMGGHPPWRPRIFPGGTPTFKFIGDTMKEKSNEHYAEVSWGGGHIYARVQQYGASITRTPAMRRFFWAKWYETDDPFWKNMALSTKQTIEIPVRSATSWIYARRQEYEAFIGKLLTIKEPGRPS